jgi:hypothetical protein
MASSVSNKVRFEVTVAGKEDRVAIARFVEVEFGSDVPDGFQAFLDWKFFAAGPEWNGSRNYIGREGKSRRMSASGRWPSRARLAIYAPFTSSTGPRAPTWPAPA